MFAAGNCTLNVVSKSELSVVTIFIHFIYSASNLTMFCIELLQIIVLIGSIPGGRREILLNKDFFVGFGKTSLKPDEIVLSVFIPVSRQVQ